MPLAPKDVKVVADAIGDAFSLTDLESLVKTATGDGLFEEFASRGDPARLAIRRTLEALILRGYERWLLVRVLVTAVSDDDLRRLIVGASPDTLSALPKADDKVARALAALDQLKGAALKPELVHMLRPSRDKITAISDEIRALSAFKDLHEGLHKLHLKLAFRLEAAVDNRTYVTDIGQTCANARTLMPQLGAAAEPETAGIAQLELYATDLQQAITRADQAATQANFEQIQRLLRLRLTGLNTRIFEAADKLSLAELIEVLPKIVAREESFLALKDMIHDLKTTVIARALIHKIWQDAENDLSRMEDALVVPIGAANAFVQKWYPLRAQVLWLASLDPDAEWAKQARSYAEQVEQELTKERFEASVAPFEALCRVLKFRFFAVDATLKLDCGALGKFHAPLKSMVEEIGHV